MFTGHTLPLSSLEGQFEITVIRDCDFSYVGKIPTRLERRLVAASSAIHIEKALAEDGIAGVVTTLEFSDSVPEPFGLAVADDPLKALLKAQAYISALADFQWQSFESRIHPSAVIGAGAYVAPRDVVIGEGTVIHPNAVILPRTIIGSDCSIGPGTVIATDAFELDTSVDPIGVVKQSGGVRIADHVDVQAKCTIVRATFGGFTELAEGTKLDCQVHFAHDCVAGRNVRIAACVEVSGRVHIGDNAFIAPNSSISNGITVGAGAKVTIGAVVTRDVPEASTVTGNFAVEHRKWLSFMRTLK